MYHNSWRCWVHTTTASLSTLGSGMVGRIVRLTAEGVQLFRQRHLVELFKCKWPIGAIEIGALECKWRCMLTADCVQLIVPVMTHVGAIKVQVALQVGSCRCAAESACRDKCVELLKCKCCCR